MQVAGIDGTKRGWVVVVLDSDRVEAFGVAGITEALDRLHEAAFVAVDMPLVS